MKAVATAHCCDLEVQRRILRKTAPFYQRLWSLVAGKDLGQNLLVHLVMFAEVRADAALTVMDCDHVDSLRFRCDAHILRIGCTTNPVLIPYRSRLLNSRSGMALMMAMIGRQNQGT